MADQPLDFNEWGRQVMGLTGKGVTQPQMDALMKEYTKYRQGFNAPPVQETTLSDGTRVAVLGNTMQVLREPTPKQSLELGQDGNLYVVDPMTGSATVVTNQAGQPFGAQKKANSMAELMAAMSGGGAGGPPPAPAQGGTLFSRIFGGVQASPSPTPEPMPTPTPMPSPTPEMQRTAGPAVPTMTNAPGAFSREQFRQMTGQDLAPGEYQDAQGRPFLIR
jgi:hypothetical protein